MDRILDNGLTSGTLTKCKHCDYFSGEDSDYMSHWNTCSHDKNRNKKVNPDIIDDNCPLAKCEVIENKDIHLGSKYSYDFGVETDENKIEVELEHTIDIENIRHIIIVYKQEVSNDRQ